MVLRQRLTHAARRADPALGCAVVGALAQAKVGDLHQGAGALVQHGVLQFDVPVHDVLVVQEVCTG